MHLEPQNALLKIFGFANDGHPHTTGADAVKKFTPI